MSDKIEAERIWSGALNVLRSILNPETFNLWFNSLKAVELADASLIVEVPNEFCGLWLKDNYHGLIRDVVGSVSGQRLDVKFRPTNAPAPSAEAMAKRPEPKIEAIREVEEVSERPVGKELPFNPRNTF